MAFTPRLPSVTQSRRRKHVFYATRMIGYQQKWFLTKDHDYINVIDFLNALFNGTRLWLSNQTWESNLIYQYIHLACN